MGGGDASQVMIRAETLARYSENIRGLTRRYGTPVMAAVNGVVSGWMAEAGMAVRRDAIGNLIGRYDGRQSAPRTLILGSHLDTVRDAGWYDGTLGVLVALTCVERLHRRGIRLPYAIEVIGFADEEGVRFHVPYLGSSVIAGSFDPASLSLRDEDGVALAEAIRAFGGKPDAIPAARRRGELLGYCEVHIEQGSILEEHAVPVGVVAAIAGQHRIRVEFLGRAGHAGSTPMAARRDALAAAAEFILAVEATGRACAGAAGTVGQVAVCPGASNVIPGQVTLTVDLRHGDAARLRALSTAVHQQAQSISSRRGIEHRWTAVQTSGPIACTRQPTELLARAIESLGFPVTSVVSMAGHDGVSFAHIAPIAMLFVRCRGGVSHHPDEHVDEVDVAVAIEVLDRYLQFHARTISAG